MKIKRGWAKHVLFIACFVLLAPLLIRSAEKALSLFTKREEQTWNSARQWEEKECWLLLRHVPTDAKTGVWMPRAEQATQTMQKAMKLSYLCAPRRLAPLGFASKQWPEFVLVAQRDEESFLVGLAAQQQAGVLGNWYPVETVQTAAGETTLYADERSDDGSPSLARNSSEQVSQELNKLMQPVFRWQDGVWPLVFVIFSCGIGHVLCDRVFHGALDTFSKTQQWALTQVPQFRICRKILS